MRSRTTRWGAALGGVALAAGVSSCGSEVPATETAQPAVGVVGAANTQEELQPGEETTVGLLLERLMSPGPETLGSFEVAMEATDGTQALTVDGAVDARADLPRLDLAVTVPDLGDLQVVVVDEGVYVSVPMLTGAGSWLEVPMEELKSLGAHDMTDTLDLQGMWQEWDVAGRSVTFVGSEEVDGEDLDHFQVVVDLDEAAGQLEDLLGAGGDATGGTGQELGELTYDLWVDDEDLMRQMTFALDDYAVELDLDAWGSTPDITAPDPADIVQMPSFGTGLTG
jgi:hypothetical protein